MSTFSLWVVAHWPLLVSFGAVAAGLTAWIYRLKAIQELRLKIAALEASAAERDSRIVRPAADDVAKYGRTGQRNFDVSTLLLLVALVGPLAVYVYDLHRREADVKRLQTELLQTAERLTATERQLGNTSRELEDLRRKLEEEVTGRGSSRRLGFGPTARAIETTTADLQRRQQELIATRDALQRQTERIRRQIDHLK